MLILSRKAEQEILIGEDIKLTIVRIEGNRVRVGIRAPRDVAVLRGELAGTAADDVSGEGRLVEREMAFAHPQPTRPVGRLCHNQPRGAGKRSAQGASAGASPASADNAAADRSAKDTTVFSGTVSADGGQVKLSQTDAADRKLAPLSGFVAAT